MKIRLNTDFNDWYDYIFPSRFSQDCQGELIRIANNPAFSIPKNKQIELLRRELKLVTPEFAKVSEFWNEDIKNNDEFVVYTDLYSHRGEGKIKLPLDEAYEKYPNNYATRYINTAKDGYQSISYRWLYIGDLVFNLRYANPDDWRSNVGENIDMSIYQKTPGLSWGINRYQSILRNYPIFAIDYVIENNYSFSFDFNTAPGTRWTGLKDLVSATKVYHAIALFFEKTKEQEFFTCKKYL